MQVFFKSSSPRLRAATWAIKAAELDTLSPFPHGLGGLTLYDARRYEDAIRFGERSLELQPAFALGVWPVVFACWKTLRA